MSLSEVQRQVELAAAELARVGADAAGWADGQRQTFDRDRMTPLAAAAGQLAAALTRMQEAQRKAQRLARIDA